MLVCRAVKRIFLFTELADASPLRTALAEADHELTVRRLQGAWFDCPLAMPPDLVVVEPARLRLMTALGPALASHPVVGRVPWLLVLDPERCHLAAQLPCNDFVLRGQPMAEVVARVERLLASRPEREVVLRSGALKIDLRGREASVHGVPMSLTPQEYALLRHLVQHHGRAFSREALLDALWGQDYTGGARTVDIHVRRLRVQLGNLAPSLMTVYGIGYKWQPPQ